MDPKTTAVVLIDLHHSNIARQLAPYSPAEVVRMLCLWPMQCAKSGGPFFCTRGDKRVAQLAGGCSDPARKRRLAAPCFGIGSGSTDTPVDLVVTERHWDAFYATELDQQLRRRGMRTIVLGGIATNFGVDSTARAAFDRGYELVSAENAMSSIKAEAHNFTVQNIFPQRLDDLLCTPQAPHAAGIRHR